MLSCVNYLVQNKNFTERLIMVAQGIVFQVNSKDHSKRIVNLSLT